MDDSSARAIFGGSIRGRIIICRRRRDAGEHVIEYEASFLNLIMMTSEKAGKQLLQRFLLEKHARRQVYKFVTYRAFVCVCGSVFRAKAITRSET